MSQERIEQGLLAVADELEVKQREFAEKQGIRLYGEQQGHVMGSEAICHSKILEGFDPPALHSNPHSWLPFLAASPKRRRLGPKKVTNPLPTRRPSLWPRRIVSLGFAAAAGGLPSRRGRRGPPSRHDQHPPRNGPESHRWSLAWPFR